MLCHQADMACREASRGSSGFEHINELRNQLWGLLSHYKHVLGEQDIPFLSRSSSRRGLQERVPTDRGEDAAEAEAF